MSLEDKIDANTAAVNKNTAVSEQLLAALKAQSGTTAAPAATGKGKPATAKAPPAPTAEDVIAAATSLKNAKGAPAVQAITKQFGATKAGEIAEDKREAAIAAYKAKEEEADDNDEDSI